MASERQSQPPPPGAMKPETNGPSSYRPAPPAAQEDQEGRFYYHPNQEQLLQRPTPRRSKRHVAEGDKDNKYWEKRKRNNDAARRSRENKRRMDVDVRQRVLIMEEELSLARKELTVLKIKYRLPLDQRFLATDDRGELVSTPMTSPVSPMTSSVMPTSNGMSNGESYCMSPNSSVPSDDSSLLPAMRQDVTSPRHQGAPHINTHLQSHLAPPSQTSPSDNMPVKKRKRGRREWEEAEDETPELVEGVANSADAYYGRMMSGNPYPGLLWPPTASAAQAQLPFPTQMPMLGPAAYQALMDEQQRLPSINAFSNVPVKNEHQQQQRQQQQSDQQHQSQQQQAQQQQQQEQQVQPQQQQQQQTQSNSAPVESTPGGENYHYLGPHTNPALPRYYVPYSDAEDAPSHNRNLTPADLSLAKSRHQTLDLPGSDISDQPTRSSHHQQIGVVQPMQGNHQQQQQQQQQQQHQQHQNISSASDEDDQQEGLMVNSDIRSRLQQLSAEVAKMKDYVLKDTVRTTGTVDDQ